MSDRVRIFCEDRRTERFLRRLCESHGIRVLDVEVAPAGEGAASDWVRARYAGVVKKRRSMNSQRQLGLLVHIDGDNVGVQQRKMELDAQLAGAGVPLRGPEEPVALLIPTWCIETWLLQMTGLAQPPETARLKRGSDAAYGSALVRLAESEADFVRTAAAAWHTFAPAISSLLDAREEARRIGIQ